MTKKNSDDLAGNIVTDFATKVPRFTRKQAVALLVVVSVLGTAAYLVPKLLHQPSTPANNSRTNSPSTAGPNSPASNVSPTIHADRIEHLSIGSVPSTNGSNGREITTPPAATTTSSSSSPGSSSPDDAPRREMIIEIYLKFRTTNDDKEGGIVTVEFWDRGATPPSKVCDFTIPEEKWSDNTTKEFSRTKVDVPLPDGPFEAKLRLTDGNEVNIGWNCDVEFALKTNNGNVIPFQKNGVRLDTTGRGRPRSAEDVIPQR